MPVGPSGSANGSAEAPRCRLYLVTPPAFAPDRFAEDLARALDAGDVAAL
jgi:thiamine-phosphate pyrophosphorylase